MTALRKPVRRITRHHYPILYCGDPRKIVVSLEPGDVLTFREAGRRQKWSVAIDRIFRQLVREAALAQQRDGKARRLRRRTRLL